MKKYALIILLIYLCACQHSKEKDTAQKVSNPQYINNQKLRDKKQFFADDSFWNQPIPKDAAIDPSNKHFIKLLKSEPTHNNFGLSLYKWTIPIFEVDSTTPTYHIQLHHLDTAEKKRWNTKRKTFGHGEGFGKTVPIPDLARPDGEKDAHMALIDWDRMLAWDMWQLHKQNDGSYESSTGMKYPLNGSGTFKTADFSVQNGESIHFHGPSRAAGVPIFAGLIMYHEVINGEIKHKLSCATRFAAFQEFVYPATWTDGFLKGGIPEGAVIQLDPNLNLSQFDLLPGEIVVAKALQQYGMVIVDVAQGQPIYAENLESHAGKSWKGVLREWNGGINTIPLDHYRILKLNDIIKKGDARSLKMPYWSEGFGI